MAKRATQVAISGMPSASAATPNGHVHDGSGPPKIRSNCLAHRPTTTQTQTNTVAIATDRTRANSAVMRHPPDLPYRAGRGLVADRAPHLCTTEDKDRGLSIEPEHHRDRHHDWHRFAVQSRRREPPLTDGVQRGGVEQRDRAQHADGLDGAALVDDRLEDDDALDVRASRDRWINWIEVEDFDRRLHAGVHAQWLGRRRGRWWRWRVADHGERIEAAHAEVDAHDRTSPIDALAFDATLLFDPDRLRRRRGVRRHGRCRLRRPLPRRRRRRGRALVCGAQFLEDERTMREWKRATREQLGDDDAGDDDRMKRDRRDRENAAKPGARPAAIGDIAEQFLWHGVPLTRKVGHHTTMIVPVGDPAPFIARFADSARFRG